MIQIYSHTFKFKTSNSDKLSNNVLSIIEEDSKKHYISYMQYQTIDNHNILSREVNIQVDRLYYLEMANISIDDIERKKRLFTVIGKRCFGRNDNKLDCYFIDNNLEAKKVYSCFEKQRLDIRFHKIQHELVTHTTNRYKAYPFYCKNAYFAVLKQTNISKRRTFEKVFLVQMEKADYTKLLAYQTNELKIDFIFNLIGKVHFTAQALEEKNCAKIEFDTQSIIDEKLEDISDGSITNQSFLNLELFENLKSRAKDIEDSYFNLLSRGMEFISEPNNDEVIFLFSSSISSYIELIEDQELFEEIVSFLEIIKIIAKEKRISYLIAKDDQDIKDIFLFMLEAITSWNASLGKDNLSDFNKSTLDLYNSLKYFIDTYFKFYYDYQSKDAKIAQSGENKNIQLHKENAVSAKEYCSNIEIDSSILKELEELESNLEKLLYLDSFNKTTKKVSLEFLNAYVRMLDSLYEFQELVYALILLIEQVEEFDTLYENKDMITLLKTIVNNLIEWKKTVFIEQSTKDIHYIDDSLYVNIAQIDVLLKDNDDFSNNIEFF